MTEPHDCENCGKFYTFTTKVDFGYGGIDDGDCLEWDSITEWEIELCSRGKCPRWVPIEDVEQPHKMEEEIE